ncbi:MAG: hypothetical protein AB1344_05655 [Pseudomonadota bacterium]
MKDFGARVVFFHKQATSARLRFLRFAHGVFGFSPLDGDMAWLPDAPPHGDGAVSPVDWHPAALARMSAEWLGLGVDDLRVETEFHGLLATTAGPLRLWAMGLTMIDPPFAEVERVGGRFIAITEARDLPPVEREALRLVYEHVLG